MKTQFKVGDRIKCIGDGYGCYSLTIGRDYTVLETTDGGDIVKFLNDSGDMRAFYSRCFELSDSPLSLCEQVKIAESLIGRRFKSYMSIETQTVSHLSVTHVYNNTYSQKVREYLETHDYCVVLHAGAICVPYDSIELVPDEIVVKLKDSYTAKVTKDFIKMGCQTFPVSILKELNDALKKL